MKKIVSIIGARPQIIKAAAISRAIKYHFQDQLKEIIVHTGQHYDDNMSAVFFKELGIPKPDINLNVGSGKHGEQTAKMITGIENILLAEKPNALVLYGDTNSTLAGAIAASKLHIPIVHIEAGLRSFNKKMPEEINRIMCDHVSTLLFSPTRTGYQNLLNEGFKEYTSGPFHMDRPRIYHSGDVMFDNSLYFKELAYQKSKIIEEYDLKKGSYILGTIHRDHNTDLSENLENIFRAIIRISKKHPIVLPLHPRTQKKMQEKLNQSLLSEIENNNILLIPPVGFLDMILLEAESLMIITDSGGVQKESYFFKKPCLILRDETEWVEIVEAGFAKICGSSTESILEGYEQFSNFIPNNYSEIFGDGHSAEFICSEIISQID